MSSQNEQSSSPTNGGVRKVALVTGITGQVYKLKTHINELNLNLIKLINNIYIYILCPPLIIPNLTMLHMKIVSIEIVIK